MAKRVYISPSDQVENKYAWGNTNEHVQCQRIAEAEAAALRRCGVEVQLAKFGTSMAQRCAESNAFGADIHNCVHTNAFNGKVTGTRLFCFAVPGKGYDACRAVFGALAPLTPGTSENIQANSRLFERIEDVPTQAITMGVGTILKAERILLIAGADKRYILEEALTGRVTPQVPASALQLHRDVTVIVCREE